MIKRLNRIEGAKTHDSEAWGPRYQRGQTLDVKLRRC